MADSYEQLQLMTKEQLISLYNRKAPSVQIGLTNVREEIARREADEQNERMLAFTRQMRNMTIAITVLTVINVLAAVTGVYLPFVR